MGGALGAAIDEGKKIMRTHIEVTAANEGAAFLGVQDGQLLKVVSESKCFIIAKNFAGHEIKISKRTKKCAGNIRAMIGGVAKRMTRSPIFNV